MYDFQNKHDDDEDPNLAEDSKDPEENNPGEESIGEDALSEGEDAMESLDYRMPC